VRPTDQVEAVDDVVLRSVHAPRYLSPRIGLALGPTVDAIGRNARCGTIPAGVRSRVALVVDIHTRWDQLLIPGGQR
jgi:hypothetical protein